MKACDQELVAYLVLKAVSTEDFCGIVSAGRLEELCGPMYSAMLLRERAGELLRYVEGWVFSNRGKGVLVEREVLGVARLLSALKRSSALPWRRPTLEAGVFGAAFEAELELYPYVCREWWRGTPPGEACRALYQSMHNLLGARGPGYRNEMVLRTARLLRSGEPEGIFGGWPEHAPLYNYPETRECLLEAVALCGAQ